MKMELPLFKVSLNFVASVAKKITFFVQTSNFGNKALNHVDLIPILLLDFDIIILMSSIKNLEFSSRDLYEVTMRLKCEVKNYPNIAHNHWKMEEFRSFGRISVLPKIENRRILRLQNASNFEESKISQR